MAGIPDIKKDLPMAMTMAAFAGIAWYICFELNIRLFLLFKRRKGLYFWSCVLCSWGVILQPLFIIMADFGVWTNLKASITLIYLSWWIMVIPQSLVLYSRLHLIMRDNKHLRWVLYMIIFNIIIFSIPTIILGILAQATSHSPTLGPINLIWDRIQTTVFFLQETALSILYIIQTRKHLKASSLLNQDSLNGNDSSRQVLHQLIYINLLVIFLDITLLAIQYANFFYLQGAYKPCVYGVKLRVEFAILNRLISSIRGRGSGAGYSYSHGEGSGSHRHWALMHRKQPS
ncbi:hypothetical protein K469DRAFT_734680 [Zopfia rhizophila CBS 207.26]|uniref:DUF7703 domain-containing protein n=1 Tax=Zopfia rhizophila CBS 207.26 TaxID=1314779 RepID=A0A6A6ESJ8_9PEZI|nr:hypothetical protein K469DRAFT_734680 [Zopfia rhizophila CBS 207.26]